MVEVGIVGGTGYTGVELLRLLAVHPEVEVTAITSRAEEGKSVTELFSNLRGHYDDLRFTTLSVDALANCDYVFFATPHGVAQSTVPSLLERGIKVIDLSADFRIRDIAVWEQWYQQQHACPELVSEAVYGLPEVNREQIKTATLVACAGCYPTSVQLGFLPLLESNVVDTSDLIANSASGVSGAGKQASVANLLSEASDSFKAYGVKGHRHLPEITQGLADIAGSGVSLTFVPHLLPMIRGIHSTLYATVTDSSIDLQQLFEQRYANEPFVDVLPAGELPQTRSVRGSNMCRISITQPVESNKVVVCVVEDNLVKGASGQAIQILNIMCGFDETTGLQAPALLP